MPPEDTTPPPPQQCPRTSDPPSLSSLLLFLTTTTLTAATALLVHHLRKPRAPSSPARTAPATPVAISALARHYAAQDPDPATRARLSSLLHNLSARDDPALRARLAAALDPANRLRFGTAGIRAAVGLGYDRLNALNVVSVAQAVHAVLCATGGCGPGGVVVGYDARHASLKFAVAIAAVFDHANVPVRLFSIPVPTPFVAYAARTLRCAAAFCVTASHNPPQDNGVKLFWRDAVQVRPDVAALVEKAVKEHARPRAEYALSRAQLSSRVEDALPLVEQAYYSDISKALQLNTSTQNGATPRAVYTACHGIGHQYIERMFDAFGLPRPIPCAEQCEPDPDFPTLPFPNPEEPGALDLAIATAWRNRVRLVLANDPDADRLGVAEVPDGGGEARVFTGNEIALLLTDYLSAAVQGRGEDMSQYAVVASTVSSKVLAAMALSRGFVFQEALTGFKWLNKVALDLEEEGKAVLITYEEAIGFNVSRNIVRDKDGISAAAVFAEMAGAIYQRGFSLAGRLEELLDECGVHLAKNGYLRTGEKSKTTAEVFDAARARGLPTRLGDSFIVSVRDLTLGTDTAEEDGKATLPADLRGQFLTFRCSRDAEAARNECPLIIHLRGSGTEPKIKYYAELKCTRDEEVSGSGQALLDNAVCAAVEEVLRPKESGLTGWL